MSRGYNLPRLTLGVEDPWSGFEWHLGDEYNIAAVVLETAHQNPERTALRHVPIAESPTSITYDELDAASSAVAGYFQNCGISRGDRVGVCLPQCPELLVAHLAAFKLGAVVVPLSMLLGDDSLEYSLNHSGATLFVSDADRAEDVDHTLHDASTVVVNPGGYETTSLGGFAAHVTESSTRSPVETRPDEPALILYTSGTTGKPKGVVQAHQYLAGSLPGYQAWFQLFDDDSAAHAHVWTPAEWAWAGALFDVVFPTLAVGGTVVSRERRSGFNPEDALGLVESERVTHTFMPATALQQIRRETTVDEYDRTTLEVVMSGGESLPEPLLRWTMENLTPVVHETYGQTEANALVGNCSDAYEIRPGSMGRPYPGHDVVIIDEDGDEVPPGNVGEIAVRLPDPAVFLEYWQDEEATAAKFRDGLFLTGDLAVQDKDGYFWHRGRKDNLIVTSGYRVSPLEVEAAIESHPSIVDAVVGGVPDPERGERVKAYVVTERGVPPGDELKASIRNTVREDIGAHKVPREISFIESVPETRSGKADRSSLFE